MNVAFIRFVILLSLSLNLALCMALAEQHTAVIEALPPNISLTPLAERAKGGNFFSPFLTNSLLQALVEDSEHKKRVQRYRDVA